MAVRHHSVCGQDFFGHVMADAAYDADHLRDFIARDLQAAAHIKRNPTRNTYRPIN